MEKYQYVVQNSLSSANKSHLERDHCMCQTKVFKQYRKQGHKVSNFCKRKLCRDFWWLLKMLILQQPRGSLSILCDFVVPWSGSSPQKGSTRLITFLLKYLEELKASSWHCCLKRNMEFLSFWIRFLPFW